MKLHRLPWLTLVLGTTALFVWWAPGAAAALALDRAAVASGAWWQLLTGHFTHWNANHVAWDLAAFLGLGALVEWRSRQLFVTTLLASALAISAVVWWAEPQLTSYRGLSGVDTALFASVVASLLRGATEQRDWRSAIVPALAIIGAVAKFAFEAATQSTVFVATSMEFVAVPSAHLAGAAVGLVAGICCAGARAEAGRDACATPPSDALPTTATRRTRA